MTRKQHHLSETAERYTTADGMLEALHKAGVSYIFANLGSDHPSIIEALAKASEKKKDFPKVIICPHETVALAAAQAYAQITGEAQAVFVHIDVGTQNLGGAVHNVWRARVPVFIFAGDTPYTIEGELFGSRNAPINFMQDVSDQRGIVRPYMKWEYEVRTGVNIQQLTYRALQIAKSDPKGPVYLMGAREVMEEEITPKDVPIDGWQPIEPIPLADSAVETLLNDLLQAENPLIITSYVGRQEEAVQELVHFCTKLAIPVVEVFAHYMNFPADSPLHLGYQAGDLLKKADLVLVLDSDVPWIPSLNKPMPDTKVYYLDIDPLKEEIPLWYIPSQKFLRADSLVALRQLNQRLGTVHIDETKRQARMERIKKIHERQRAQWTQKEVPAADGTITPEFLSACIREVIDEDTIILNEAVTNQMIMNQHIPRTKPGTFYFRGGTSLGWNGGAAIGAKLAAPEKTVVSITGDGSYLFSVPSSVYWMARRYNTPFLTVIYNNHGWAATKENVLALHPDGAASRNDTFWVNFQPSADLAKIAEAAGGAYAQTVTKVDELKDALRKGLGEVHNGRSAVIDVHLEPISHHQY